MKIFGLIGILIIGILILYVLDHIENKLAPKKEDCKGYEIYKPSTFILVARCYITEETKFCLNLKGYFPDINCTIKEGS